LAAAQLGTSEIQQPMSEADKTPADLNEPSKVEAADGLQASGPGPGHVSLEGLHGTVSVPPMQTAFWPTMRAFVGPAILISVGYMDPGNWGTDLAGGAQFKYGLLWVVALASLMAVILQIISARLGVATGKDLAQCCRDYYPRWTRWPNWITMEIAIGMTDLAESLGSAVALNMLFHIPLQWAIIITAFDVLLLLALQGFGARLIEAVVTVFVLTIGICYGIEIFGLAQTQPNFLPWRTRTSRRPACFLWRSASSERPSCHTTCTSIQPWFRPENCSRTNTPSAAPSVSIRSTRRWR
jgi:hypothetical protein